MMGMRSTALRPPHLPLPSHTHAHIARIIARMGRVPSSLGPTSCGMSVCRVCEGVQGDVRGQAAYGSLQVALQPGPSLGPAW
jgi:hypothetical protein